MTSEELSGKQKRYLRALGNAVKPAVFIGQRGVNVYVIQSIEDAFNTSELIKLRVQEGFAGDRHDVALELADAVSAHLVQVLGKTILLFRCSLDAPKIELPPR